MPKYNPNSIWGSKEKQYEYNPPETKKTAPPSGSKEISPAIQEAVKDGSRPPYKPPEKPLKPEFNADDSFFKRHGLLTFTVAGILFLALIGLVFYLIWPSAGPDVTLTFIKPDQVQVGTPFTFTLSASNNSNNTLKGANVSVHLPAGVSFVGSSASQSVSNRNIGDVNGGSIAKQDFQLIATGNPGSVQDITAHLTYGTSANAQAQFETDGDANITVSQAPAVSLNFTAPANIFSGQDFDMTVNYTNNTTKDMKNVGVKLVYPPAFTFVRASGTPSSGNDTWSVTTLPAKGSSTFTVTGHIVGPIQAQYSVTGNAQATFSGQAYTVNTETANFSLASSPLSLTIAVNNSSSYITKLSDNLQYVLTYTNNSNATFQTVSIKAALVGAMYDFSSLKSNATFDSRANTLTWYTANTPELLSLAPGQSGSVNFTVGVKKSFPIRLPSDKNYSLKVSATIQSPTVPANTAGNGTVSVTTAETKVAGQITLATKGYFHEPSAAIKNTGPYPPKVNQQTQYTIHWDITNYATDMQNVTLSAFLQSGATFTGKVTSNIGSSTPVYNPATGEITWTIPAIAATAGILGAPVEAVFQVANTPAVNQVGQTVSLLGPTTLTATDAFTGLPVQISGAAITTDLPDDATLGSGQGLVTQ